MDLSQTCIENASSNSKLIDCLQKSNTCFVRDIFSSGSSVILWAGTENIPYETSFTFLEAVNELRI